MRRLFVVFVLLVCMFSPGVMAADDSHQELYDQANKELTIAKEAGDNEPEVAKAAYLKAAEIFTQIIRDGVKNSDIYYNLGNCYYQAQDYPLAILQYRRALVFAPDDEKINANIASAQRNLRSEEPQSTDTGFWGKVVSFNSKIPLLFKEYFNKLSYVLFWGGLIGYLYFRKRVNKKKLLIIAIVWWLSLCAVALVSYLASSSADGVILQQEVVARKGDGDNYAEAFLKPLKAGTEFKLIEKRGDWLKVELDTGNECWIKASTAGLVKDEP